MKRVLALLRRLPFLSRKAQRDEDDERRRLSVIGKRTRFVGTMDVDGDLYVAGKVEGAMLVTNRLYISGKIIGDVESYEVFFILSGILKGNVCAWCVNLGGRTRLDGHANVYLIRHRCDGQIKEIVNPHYAQEAREAGWSQRMYGGRPPVT